MIADTAVGAAGAPEYEEGFLDVKGVAAVTGLSVVYLDKLRMLNNSKGPPFFRVGRRCLYPRQGLRTWAATRVNANMANGR